MYTLQTLDIDGTPLEWFYKPYLGFGDLPKFNSARDVFIKSKFLGVNENIKRLISNKKHTMNYISKKVLFLTFTNHIKDKENISRLTLLLKKIRKDKKIQDLVLICSPLSELPNKKLMELNNTIYGFMEDIDINGIKIQSKLLSERWKGNQGLQSDFLYSYEFIFLTLLHYETIKKIIDDYEIRLIFLTGDGSIVERCAIAVANNKGIYTMLNPHGYVSPIVTDYHFFKKAKITVCGNEQEQMLISQGFSKDNIRQTGALTFDNMFAQLDKYKESKYIKRFFPKQVLVLTQAAVEKEMIDKETYFKYIKMYLESLNRLENASTTVKLHPVEKHTKEYEKIVQPLKNISISKEKDVNKLIAETDLVVSFRTSVILNSMLMDKPVIRINLLDESAKKRYDMSEELKMILALDYKNPELAKTVKKILDDDILYKLIVGKQNNYIENYFYRQDGESYERIAEYIYELVL